MAKAKIGGLRRENRSPWCLFANCRGPGDAEIIRE
jgi:hypothetical protein